MRRVLATLLTLLLLATPAAAADPPRVVIDYSLLELPHEQLPYIENGRTMVPMRAIFEALGAAVAWDGETRTVTAEKAGTRIRLTIDQTTAHINGQAVALDQPARIVSGRTFVPIRFVSESLGARASWLDQSRTVAISTRPLPPAGSPFQADAAAGELARKALRPGETLVAETDGIYFLDLETGALEGYSVAGAARGAVGYTASPGGRFVIARSKDTGWILERTSGRVHRWDRLAHDLVTAGDTHLLFQEVRGIPGNIANAYAAVDGRLENHLSGQGRYTVLSPDLKPVASFELSLGNGQLTRSEQALFSPDGDRLVIARDEQAYLIELPTGKVLQEFHSPARFQPVKGGTEFIAFFSTPRGHSVTRYNWRGEPQAQATIEARFVEVSADGEWVAWEVVRDRFTPAVYYARLAEAHNPFQALGATMCYGYAGRVGARWAESGSGDPYLMVRTKDGLGALHTDGTARNVPGFDHRTYDFQVAAPGKPNLFAFRNWLSGGDRIGAVDGNTGNLLADVTIQSKDWFRPFKYDAFWGSTPDEVRFTIRQHYGSGGPCGDYAMPLGVKVSRPGTFDWTLALQVKGTGSCLNVRSEPSLGATPVTCLQDGTRIPLGNNASWETLPDFLHNGDGQWFKVRLESGAQGWILVSSGYVDFAR